MQTLNKIIKISFIVSILVFIINLIFNDFKIDYFKDLENWGIMVFYSLSLTIVNVLYADLFEKYVGWENAGPKRVFLSASGSIIVTLIAYFLCRLIQIVLLVPTKTLTEFISEEKLRYYLFPLLFSTVISLFFHLVYFFRARQEEKVKEQQIIAGTATSRFDALKNQLDPHFLFNSLNVLSSLIDEDPDMAQKFTGSLSKVYRYVLQSKHHDLISLKKELEFIDSFI